jgi:methionine-rich copper-binding protein CopC
VDRGGAHVRCPHPRGLDRDLAPCQFLQAASPAPLHRIRFVMNRKLTRTSVSLCICALLVVFTARELQAHAILVEGTPNAGATVSGPDVPIHLRFNVRIDGDRSRITLVAPAGLAKQLALAKQATPDVLTTKADGLIAGKYKLQWQVLAADGHISRGELTFTVQ